MRLKNSADPRRAIAWNNKSLANCSRRELIDCVLHLARQIAILEGQLKPFMEQLKEMPVEVPVENKDTQRNRRTHQTEGARHRQGKRRRRRG